jgi:glucose/mannose-6-phosphate isomerase
MVDLDNLQIYQQLDTSGMLNHLHKFPEECKNAWERVLSFDLPKEYAQIDKVIILGMGGSAIGGAIARRLALAESETSVLVYQDYGLPSLVDADTLVIASSYSGNTEETLSAFTESLKTPAKKLVITAGGKLKRLAQKERVPVFSIDYEAPPRAAFPHSFIPLIGIFQKLGLLRDKSESMQEALRVLNKLSGELVETCLLVSNPAKQLATKLWGHIIIIYGAEILSEVAQRWKGQLNENGKTWAFCELFPELNHNAVVGYEFPSQAKEKIFVVLLRSGLFHARILMRYEATAKLMARAGVNYEFVEPSGASTLAQMLSLVFWGDYLSFYLAMLNGIDPTPVDSIDFVKSYLAQL